MEQGGPGQVGTGQVGIPEVGPGEVGSFQVGAFEVRTAQVGLAQVGTRQVGCVQDRTRQDGVAHVGTGQVGSGQASARQVGTGHVGPGEVDSPEIDTPEIRPAQTGPLVMGPGGEYRQPPVAEVLARAVHGCPVGTTRRIGDPRGGLRACGQARRIHDEHRVSADHDPVTVPVVGCTRGHGGCGRRGRCRGYLGGLRGHVPGRWLLPHRGGWGGKACDPVGDGGGLVCPLGHPAHFIPDLPVSAETRTTGLDRNLMVVLGQPGSVRSEHLDREVLAAASPGVPVGDRPDAGRCGDHIGQHVRGRDRSDPGRSAIMARRIGSGGNPGQGTGFGFKSTREEPARFKSRRGERRHGRRVDPPGNDRPVIDGDAPGGSVRPSRGIVEGDGGTMGILVGAEQLPVEILDGVSGCPLRGREIPGVAELPDLVTWHPGRGIRVIANGDDALGGRHRPDMGDRVGIIRRAHPVHPAVTADWPGAVGLQVLRARLSRRGNADSGRGRRPSVMVETHVIDECPVSVQGDPVPTRRTAPG